MTTLTTPDFADQYHAARANAAWAAMTSEAKLAALTKATDFIDVEFGSRFVGEKSNPFQEMSWPRTGVRGIDSEAIPNAVQKACAELALKVGSGTELFVDEGRTVIREKVGPLETEYADTTSESKQTRFVFVEKMLASVLVSSATGGFAAIKLVRV